MSSILTFGEIMLRLSTYNGTHLSDSINFQAHYGGAEANVAINLANLGHNVTFASKVPDNALGLAAKKHLQKYGVSTKELLFGGPRLGTYYLDFGTGERPSSVTYDRAYSSFASLQTIEWDLDQLFENVSIFHLSGITPALSETLAEMTLTMVKEAKKRNIKISFDINYRSKLWHPEQASNAIGKILPFVDYCSAGKLDAIYLLGIPEQQTSESNLDYYYQKMHKKYSNIQVFYSTIREVISTTSNNLQGTLWQDGKTYVSKVHHLHPIVDRVGGGDAFAAGILHGLATGADPTYNVSFATASSSLKHTVFGDCNPFTVKEVENMLDNVSAKINR
ncbi:sugar kinase [Neobacillus kokaensis]|uniref:2-dehydro-3-deoxygluconokinase n=1 Tax=Neobacillus kokaensis TaxID=2759023 RepID=A0ABQ3N5U2_9BACI|nr:sugar kinase [Neobacillus kokaensis]GHI00083.1 2-dehydro-3-deoxygluconokinase [Neobacillus kokaensis]